MKVLQVNCVYGAGSTGRLVKDIHQYGMDHGIESVVCYGRGQRVFDPYIYKVSTEAGAKIHSIQSRLFGVEFSHSFFATQKLLNIIKKESPNVVHLHCLNGHFINVYRTIRFLKHRHLPTVLTLHAEIMHTAGCDHAMECDKWKTCCSDCSKVHGILSSYFLDDAKRCYHKMQKAMAGFNEMTVVGVSQWLTDRARQSPILGNARFETINNGVDTAAFSFRSTISLLQRYPIGNRKVILHVTPNFYSAIKGGSYVLLLAEKMPQVCFVIVGYSGDCNMLPANVIPLEHTTDKQELAQLYSLADITLLTSKRETFSMVCAESLCCGTPVVGFKAGAPETIGMEKYCEFVEQGDVDALQKAVTRWLYRDNNKSVISREAALRYSSQKMCEAYYALYKRQV